MGTYERLEKHRKKKHFTGYSDKYDAYYCITCNEWLEKGCEDKDCSYCSTRPDEPFENKKLNLRK